jgi:hypothetical protein
MNFQKAGPEEINWTEVSKDRAQLQAFVLQTYRFHKCGRIS